MDKAGNSLLWRKLHDPGSVLTPRQDKPWPPAQSQFPSKYGQLPGIGDSPHPSPRPSQENQLVPVRSGGKDNRASMGQRSNTDQSDTEERMRQLEMRLGVSEKSNRALLEEVLRLQNDLRIATKRSEEVIRDERDARQQLSEAIRISNELISQLSERIKETEEKIQDEKASLSSLFNHTKNVEKTVLTSQQDLQSRRDAQSLRLQELRAEINETKQARSQLEQVTYALSDELRSLRNKVEGQQAEFVNMVSDVRNRARKLEDESRIHLETMRKQSDMHSMSDVTTTQLRGQVETRLSELRDVLMDVRGKQETEQNERRNLEKAMQAKINELYTSLSEQTRKREEGLHTVDMVLREKDHAAQAERLQMTSKVTDTVEDINKRLLAKEMKIREEIQQKFLQLEKLVQREQHSRQEFEKSSREDGDRKWQTLKKVLEEELNILKEKLEVERGRSRDTIAKLDQSITIVEKQLAENKRQVDKVMTAEIKSRKLHEAGTAEKIGSVNEKLQVATSTLQQAIGGVSQSMASNNEKIRRELKTMMTEQQQAGTRALSDMDARMNGIKQRMTTLEDQLDARVASVYNDSWKEFANMELGELDFETKDEKWETDSGQGDELGIKEMDMKNMSQTDVDLFNVLCFIFNDVNSKAAESLSSRVNERVEAITKWQDATGDTLRELGRSVQTIPQDIYQLEEKYKLLKSEMDSRVSHESDSRMKDIQVLRKEVGIFKSLIDTLPKPVTLTREVETLRQEITMLKSRLDRQPKPATLQDLEAMNVNVRKLADNLQTVKTVLGMKIQSEQKLRVSGLEDLQSQINQIKILSGSNLKLSSLPQSQLEDLDTGLGWEDLGTYGTATGTPSSSQNDHSRQQISAGYKPVSEPIREATREESPYAKQGGLKNMNMPSPTPKTNPKTPEKGDNNQTATDRQTPGNVTPPGWQTPENERQTPVDERADNRSPGRKSVTSPNKTGRKSQASVTGKGTQTPGKQTPSPRKGGNTPGKETPRNQTPRNQTPGGTNRSEGAQDGEN